MNKCIEVSNLSVESLWGHKILDSISLSIECGDFVVVSGPSGGGKSTLLKVLIGVRNALENLRVHGDVRVLGVNVLENGFSKLFGKIGVVLQNPVNQLFSMTVEEEIAFPLENAGFDPSEIRKRVEEVLKIMDLEGIRRAPVHKLSIGQMQRVVLASALALRPSILILDEPCAYLDPATKKRFYSYVSSYWRESGATILVVEHDLDYVLSHATKLLLLNRKIIAYGPPIEVLNNVRLEEHGVKEPVYIKLCRYFHRICRDVDELIECLKKFICLVQ